MQNESVTESQQDALSVRAVRQGDVERYRELVQRHERRVFAVAWSRLGDATLAEEATQEAFIRGYRQLRGLVDGAKFAGWISSIARNAAINLGLRHRRELHKRERWALAQEAATEDAPDQPCTPELLQQTLQEMPPEHRECLVLFYLEGKSGAEAAATLGIAEGTFRVRLHRAKAELREHLQTRLEQSLERLRPAKALAPVVMAAVLGSTSAKAATAGAAGAGLGAKLLSSAGMSLTWLTPFISVIGALPGLLASWFFARAEQRNFRDQSGVRPELHRRFFRSFAWGFPLFVLLIALVNQGVGAAWGIKGIHLWVSCLVLVVTLVAARSLVISRHPFHVGMFGYCLVLTLGVGAVALGWIPPSLAQLPMVAGTVLMVFLVRYRPARMDYSLFLRAAQRLFKSSGAAPPALPDSPLPRSAQLAFARFLGERFLVATHSWEGPDLRLRLAPVRARFMANMMGVFLPVGNRTSRIVLGADGLVTAHCGADDAAALAELFPAVSKPTQLETAVMEALQEAWGQFRSGNIPDAERAVGQIPELEIFAVTPARAASTRWLQWLLGGAAVLMAVAMFMSWQNNRLRMVSGRHLKPVDFSEAQVQASLAQLASATNNSRQLLAAGQTGEVLPPRRLFTETSWLALQSALHQKEFLPPTSSPAVALDRFLGFPALQGMFLNDWVTAQDLHLDREAVRQALTELSAAAQRRLFQLRTNGVMSHDRTPLEYTALDTRSFARQVRSLRKLGCLDLVDGSNAVATVLAHQVLSGELPPGRRQGSDPKLWHGTFLTFGQNPIQDTWQALTILDAFGALQQIDREACVGGILRFHHGKGLFGSVREGDGLVIFGDAEDTLYAFESLRMLNGLDRVTDLPEWLFRPHWTSKPEGNPPVRRLNERELEAWVCEERLRHLLAERQANPSAPFRSLLEP